jgi:hypothetical protein
MGFQVPGCLHTPLSRGRSRLFGRHCDAIHTVCPSSSARYLTVTVKSPRLWPGNVQAWGETRSSARELWRGRVVP